MANAAGMPTLDQILDALQGTADSSAFIMTPGWVSAVLILAVLSLLSSVAVLGTVGWVYWKHGKYLKRLSLRISGFVAVADMINSLMTIITLSNSVMLNASMWGLRLAIWVINFSILAFLFLTISISLQLHLSTLTKIRVRSFMKLESFYVPVSFVLAAILPSIQVGLMTEVYWDPSRRAFHWPVDPWKMNLTLWMCNFVWIVVTIVYCAGVAGLVSLRILQMWKNSIQIAYAPHVPEKWDWSRFADSSRSDPTTPHSSRSTALSSQGTLAVHGAGIHDSPTGHGDLIGSDELEQGSGSRGYVVTLMGSDPRTGRPVAVRTYVDKRRFLLSVQRLVCYPLVPVITQLGAVAMNVTRTPVRGLYIYGTTTSAIMGLLNLVVFLLNPALPDIWKDAACGRS